MSNFKKTIFVSALTTLVIISLWKYTSPRSFNDAPEKSESQTDLVEITRKAKEKTNNGRDTSASREFDEDQARQEIHVLTQGSQQNMSQTSDVTKVVLAAYFRGGSTFVGEMMNNNPDAFYMFEPLNSPYRKWNKLFWDHAATYYTKNKTVDVPPEAFDELAGTVVNILNCDFEKLDKTIMTHFFYTSWKKSHSMLDYRTCFRKNKLSYGAEKAADKCIPDLKQICKSKSIRSTKLIRMTGLLAEKVLERDPTVKIVHYVRDPRGMIVSRATMGKSTGQKRLNDTERMDNEANTTCNVLRFNMRRFDELAKEYSVLGMRYEDLAFGPYKTAETLYDFLGLSLPDDLRTWIDENTHADTDNGALGTRRNSTAVAERWRSTMPQQSIDVVAKRCADVLEYLDYSNK